MSNPMRKLEGLDFWVGRLSVEIAVALTALELGNEDLARAGLRECLNEFLDSQDSSQELLVYLDEMKQEKQRLVAEAKAVQVQPTVNEIASRL